MSSSGFPARLERCNFFMTAIKYLDFITNKNGCKQDPANIEAYFEMPISSDGIISWTLSNFHEPLMPSTSENLKVE